MKNVFDGGYGDCGNPALALYLDDLPEAERIEFENELKDEDPEAWAGFQDYMELRNQLDKL